MAYATIMVRFFIFLSPGRLIKKVGRDVTDRDFELFVVPFFNYLCGLFYYAHDSDA